MSLYQRDEPISIDHARRLASACIGARLRFALRFEGKIKAFVATTEAEKDEIERLILETTK